MSKVEELARKYCEGSSFEDACMEKPAYIAGYSQAEKDLIAKACEYLDLHCNEVKTEDNGIAGWIDNEFITNFRKAMKNEDKH